MRRSTGRNHYRKKKDIPQFKIKKVDKDRNPCQGAESETANYAKLATANQAKAG